MPALPVPVCVNCRALSNKIRQSDTVKGVSLCGNEIKISQFADDTNLICADIPSVENALQILVDFGKISGLTLNKEKTKAMWLGRSANNKNKPLGFKWVSCPTRFLGVHLSYDKKGNDYQNFDLKIGKLQTNLDMWRMRDLTLFGRVLIVKSLGISQLIYSAFNVDVPNYVISTVKKRLFGFLWKNNRDKIKRVGLYQNYDKGGLRMPDLECMIKALRMAWIPRLLKEGHQNWKTVPDHFFKRYGGLEFILVCNYNVKFFENLPNFYKDILLYFSELKTLYNHDNMCEIILFNNKDILIGGKPFFNKEWFSRQIISITDLLDAEGRFLSFSDFQSKYRLRRTNLLQFYQVINAIPKHLLAKSINKKLFAAESDDFVLDPTSFCLESGVKLDLTKMKSKE